MLDRVDDFIKKPFDVSCVFNRDALITIPDAPVWTEISLEYRLEGSGIGGLNSAMPFIQSHLTDNNLSIASLFTFNEFFLSKSTYPISNRNRGER